MTRIRILAAAVLGLTTGIAGATTTTFDNGIEGWGVFFDNDGFLGDFLESEGGNAGAHLRWQMIDTFGMTLRNETNLDFLGDYARFGGPVRIGLDMQVHEITFWGSDVERNLIVQLVDYDDQGGPDVSVWYNLGEISAALTSDWTKFEVVIDDPTAAALPAGWGGTGDEDEFGAPFLPAHRTFASVLANVDEIRFTTYEPGWFYGFTNFHVRFDNPSVALVPEPATLGLLAGLGLVALRRR